MAYVPGFEWDLFISYPRESDQPDAYDFEWVNEFHRVLEREIKERLPSKDGPKIYFDRRDFAAADHLGHDLLEAARNSALFMPIVSPSFVAPGKFTLEELEVFCESGKVDNRIVTIELLPVTTGRPDALQGPKRNNFHVREGNVPIKLSPRSEKYGDLYATRLQIVAEEVKDVLQEMRRNAGGSIKEGRKPFSGKTVLLAEKEENVDHQWEDIRAYLRDFGASILPTDGKYPDDELEFSSAFTADFGKADLFIQLLSPMDEAIHWNLKPSRARLQYSSAMSHARHIPLLQWRNPGIRPEALRYWDKELLEGPHVVALGLEEFKREIKKKLVAPPTTKINPTPKPYVYIAADDADLGFALELKEMAEGTRLADNCEIIAAKNRIKNFKQSIKVTDIIVVLYGAGNPEFVDEWLRTYAKLKANGLAKPPQLEALYRAPPPKIDIRQKLRGPLGSFLPFGSEDAFSVEGMRGIFEELRRRMNGSPGAAAT